MTTIAIVAALERELPPLVRGWRSCSFTYGGRMLRAYESENLVAVAGGIGRKAARDTALALARKYQLQMLVSMGVAGSLQRSLKVGEVVIPGTVADSESGAEYPCKWGSGVLVTADEIAGSAAKQALAERFHAVAVDMEAAAVAEVAREQRMGFGCIKAISDEPDFAMPPLGQFVGKDGGFQSGRFLVWAMLRPFRWPEILALARNTRRATQALDKAIRDLQEKKFASYPGQPPSKTTKVLDV